MKNLFLLILVALLMACTNQGTEQKTDQTAVVEKTTNAQTIIKNYAVVWDWTTENHEFILENLKGQIEDFQKLFDKGVIENVYLNNFEFTQINENAKMTTIMFFIKARSEKEAGAILDEMEFVKKRVAKYRIYPVGSKMLGRHESADENKTFSFAAVWANTGDKELIEKNVEAQFEETTQLWSKGIIENAYFASEAAYKRASKVPGMAYFVNAATEDEARAILDNMIFVKKGIATYRLFPVGTFWLGSKDD